MVSDISTWAVKLCRSDDIFQRRLFLPICSSYHVWSVQSIDISITSRKPVLRTEIVRKNKNVTALEQSFIYSVDYSCLYNTFFLPPIRFPF
jgi:hypothetical protein